MGLFYLMFPIIWVLTSNFDWKTVKRVVLKLSVFHPDYPNTSVTEIIRKITRTIETYASLQWFTHLINFEPKKVQTSLKTKGDVIMT